MENIAAWSSLSIVQHGANSMSRTIREKSDDYIRQIVIFSVLIDKAKSTEYYEEKLLNDIFVRGST